MDAMLVPRPVWAEVDLDALAHNIREVRRLTNRDAEILAAVKADAYGHGAVTASKTFLDNGADRLGVATLTEAVELRNAGIDAPILNLGYTPDEHYDTLIRNRVAATIYTPRQAEALDEAAARLSAEAVAHIKVDTGMGRLGFQPSDEAIRAIAKIDGLQNVRIEGIYTHFAISDAADKTYTRHQFELFTWVLAELKKKGVEPPIRHVSNSAAIIDLPEYALDMVRPGIMLYGYEPSPDVALSRVSLKPAMTLKARLSNVKAVPESAGISYGLTYTTKRPSIIGTLPIGYADGYRRALSNRGWVDVHGDRAPIVGRVCMDQCMIDLTDAGAAEIGDEVTLFGGGCAPRVEEVAKLTDTIPHEVTCAVARRVPRVFTKGRKAVEVRDYLQG
ncbi:MAG: alanine racemase [Candidatus Bathyarchaeota archaeon]|nr:alanine racemase [Candidatus Bathyarchaeota archaeon]